MSTTPIGREFSVVVFGATMADHPIGDEIFDAVHQLAEKHGLDVTAGSFPYFEEGTSLDRKLAEVTAERDRLREFIETQVMPIFWVTGGEEAEVTVPRERLERLVNAARELLAGGDRG